MNRRRGREMWAKSQPIYSDILSLEKTKYKKQLIIPRFTAKKFFDG